MGGSFLLTQQPGKGSVSPGPWVKEKSKSFGKKKVLASILTLSWQDSFAMAFLQVHDARLHSSVYY